MGNIDPHLWNDTDSGKVYLYWKVQKNLEMLCSKVWRRRIKRREAKGGEEKRNRCREERKRRDEERKRERGREQERKKRGREGERK